MLIKSLVALKTGAVSAIAEKEEEIEKLRSWSRVEEEVRAIDEEIQELYQERQDLKEEIVALEQKITSER